MRQNLIETIGERVIIADGAIGTQLQRAGIEPGSCFELWNVDHPGKVKAIHKAYVEAGADLITTNSFRGNSIALALYGLESRVEHLNIEAARLAREAAGDNALVMGSVGPLGGFLEPLGKIPVETGFYAFLEQSRALVKGGAQAIIIETMTATDELELAVSAAREAGAPVIIATMAFDKARDGYKTMMGVSITQAVEAATRAGADVIGCNCGADLRMSDYANIVKEFCSRSDRPIIVQANAGRPELINNKISYKQTPEIMAAEVESLVAAGGSIIGGCCGTGPEHTKLFAERLKLKVEPTKYTE